MALVIANRVREASATIGTGAMSLLGAALGYQSFATAVGAGNTTYYAVVSGAGQWEIGLGTVVGTELQRTTVLDSSSGGSLVNFAPGTKDVFATLPANIPALVEDLAATGAGKGAEMVAFKQAGAGAVDRTASEKLREFVSVKDFGAVGDGVVDDTNAIQAAVNYACNAQKKLVVPAGGYRLGQSITFPNKSFVIEGEGPTATYFKALEATPNVNLFDFSNCNGPAKVVRNIGFEGPAQNVYGGGSGVKCSNTNGLLLEGVWWRGIRYGLEISASSFVNTRNCVFEYCFLAMKVNDALDESIWSDITCYRNETDLSISGNQKTFEVRGISIIGTMTDGIKLLGTGAIVRGITAQSDGSASTPNILNITGSKNRVDGLKCTNYGLRGVFLQGAGATGNRITAVDLDGVPTGVHASSASGNTISDFSISNATTQGVRVDSCTNNFRDFDIDGCGYGISINAAEMCKFVDGEIKNSVSSDWHQTTTNTGRLVIENVEANFSGISTVPFLMSVMPSGNYLILTGAVPTAAYPFTRGDIAVNRQPAVASPKGWRCTVSGSPGTWVSEGNL